MEYDKELEMSFTLQLHPQGIVIRDVQSGREKARLSYNDIHSFEADRCLFWITTCACGSVPASLHFFLVGAGDTACLTLLKELQQAVLLYSKQASQSTLLPIASGSDPQAQNVATVTVDQHLNCVFPRHLDPLKICRQLSRNLLPLCAGMRDRLSITRRTGNSALMCGHTPRDYFEKYAPKGSYPRRNYTAEEVHAPTVKQGASPCLSLTSADSGDYLCVRPSRATVALPGLFSVASKPRSSSAGTDDRADYSNTIEEYTLMSPEQGPIYLELLTEVGPLPCGATKQFLTDGTVLDRREAGMLADAGATDRGTDQEGLGQVATVVPASGGEANMLADEESSSTHGSSADEEGHGQVVAVVPASNGEADMVADAGNSSTDCSGSSADEEGRGQVVADVSASGGAVLSSFHQTKETLPDAIGQ